MLPDPNPEALLDAIERRPPAKGESTYAIIISCRELADLPNVGEIFESIVTRLRNVMNARTEFMGSVDGRSAVQETMVADRSIELYMISHLDMAVFLSANEYRIIGAVNEAKLNTLRILDRLAPNRAPMVDQAQLIQVFDLWRHKRAAVLAVKALSNEAELADTVRRADKLSPMVTPSDGSAAEGSAKAAHSFADQMAFIEQVVDRIGPAAFFDIFVGRQQIVMFQDSGKPEPIYTELFVKLAKVRDYLFRGRLELDRIAFGRLTEMLDRIVLRGFAERPSLMAPNSAVNLNVSTVFTPEFEVFESTPEASLSKLTIEFRCADILENFDEFLVARDLILSRSGKITIDGVQPNLLGVIDFSRLGASLVKLIWNPMAEAALIERRSEIAKMQQKGIIFVLCRVEGQDAVKFAHGLKIRLFQGFFLDAMVKSYGDQVDPKFGEIIDRLRTELEDFDAGMRIFGTYRPTSGVAMSPKAFLTRIQQEVSEVELTASTVQELQLLIDLKKLIFRMNKDLG